MLYTLWCKTQKLLVKLKISNLGKLKDSIGKSITGTVPEQEIKNTELNGNFCMNSRKQWLISLYVSEIIIFLTKYDGD